MAFTGTPSPVALVISTQQNGPAGCPACLVTHCLPETNPNVPINNQSFEDNFFFFFFKIQQLAGKLFSVQHYLDSIVWKRLLGDMKQWSFFTTAKVTAARNTV